MDTDSGSIINGYAMELSLVHYSMKFLFHECHFKFVVSSISMIVNLMPVCLAL